MDVGEAAFDAVVVEAELFVVEPQEVEDGGVEVVDGDDVFGGSVAEVVGGAVGVGSLDPRAGQEGGEAGGVVVASAGAFLEGGHATEFGAPNH